jgi:hypothetical protein
MERMAPGGGGSDVEGGEATGRLQGQSCIILRSLCFFLLVSSFEIIDPKNCSALLFETKKIVV